MNTGGATGSGGASGKGGAVGSGGASQKGGSTGAGGIVATGGTTGTGGIKTTGTGGTGYTCVGCKVSIQAYCQTDTSTNEIKVTVDVVDGSLNALPLSSVTFRYWFMLGETTDPPMNQIDYAQIGSALITSKFVAVSPAVTGANEYVEIGFGSSVPDVDASVPTLTGFNDSGQIQLHVTANNNASLDVDQTADYSFQKCGDASTSTFVPTPTITGYINGVLAWGHEPS